MADYHILSTSCGDLATTYYLLLEP
uniref:Uncharacterized protein n=1 Tax=Arundo donax TaxID=35708 RepID=A0A0A9BMZ6_ARUDO